MQFFGIFKKIKTPILIGGLFSAYLLCTLYQSVRPTRKTFL